MTQNNLPIIGVTGITGSGTSTVAAVLAERGGFLINADKLAHDAMKKNEPAYNEILQIFGHEILQKNGEINRRALGAKVFASKDELERLEKIIHPRVIERTRAIVKKISDAYAHTFVIIDAPLLIESDMHEMCDSVWLITAPNDLRISRITARDKIDESVAARRLQSRIGDDFLRAHANIIIENDGSTIALRSKTESALKAMSLKINGWKGMEGFQI